MAGSYDGIVLAAPAPDDSPHGGGLHSYLLACLECGNPGRPLPIPFGDQAERGRWASEHTRATGHDRWRVREEKRDG